MNFFRVGVVDFFGILCPGVLLLVNLLILLSASHVQVDELWKPGSQENGGIILSLLLFVICYLFGFVLRLIPPDYLDKAAGYFGMLVRPSVRIEKRDLCKWLEKKGKILPGLSRREHTEKLRQLLPQYIDDLMKTGCPAPEFFWMDELYPYYLGSKWVYYRSMSAEIAHEIMGQTKDHNKNTYNFWKTFLASKDSNLAMLVFQAEAFVRFMSGSFWALLLGVVSGIILTVSGLMSHHDIRLAVSLTVLSMLMAIIILVRFKNQRRREVKILLDAVFITTRTSRVGQRFGDGEQSI